MEGFGRRADIGRKLSPSPDARAKVKGAWLAYCREKHADIGRVHLRQGPPTSGKRAGGRCLGTKWIPRFTDMQIEKMLVIRSPAL